MGFFCCDCHQQLYMALCPILHFKCFMGSADDVGEGAYTILKVTILACRGMYRSWKASRTDKVDPRGTVIPHPPPLPPPLTPPPLPLPHSLFPSQISAACVEQIQSMCAISLQENCCVIIASSLSQCMQRLSDELLHMLSGRHQS